MKQDISSIVSRGHHLTLRKGFSWGLGLAIGLCTLASCDDYLTREPYNKEDSESFFSNEEELNLYANGLYVTFIPDAEALSIDNTPADNIALTSTPTFFQSSFDSYDQSGWTYSSWRPLFRCNYFLEHIDKAKGSCTEAVLNHYRAIARFWRAWFYFGQVRTYGNVPWYSHTIEANDSVQLYKTRDDRELVMDSVLADLDYACENLQADKDLPINRYVALAFKSRVCLFEGTFRKYHSVNPSTNEAWKETSGDTRFLEECVDASETLMNTGAYSLNTGDSLSYRQLFTTETPNANEVILAREYSQSLSITNNVTQLFNLPSYKMGAPQEFVNMYLLRDGSRFTDISGYQNKSYEDNFTNRDWRLGETFVKPGYTINDNGTQVSWPVNWEIGITGYQIMKFNIDDKACHNTGKGYQSFSVLRYAEVLLNEAEAKCELGEMSTDVWDKTIRPIRERAGVNGKEPTTADAYLEEYYLNQTTDPYLLEIRRERSIELFMEGGNLRYWDLIRWHLGDLFAHEWSCVKNAQQNVNLSTNKFYELDGTTLKVKNEVDFTEKKYVRPIPHTALVVNPNLKQNYGWE